MSNRSINIATDFSAEPFGRYPSDGDSNGTRFRDEWLIPALTDSETVSVIFDGAEGYGSSFLEESFGGLVRLCGFAADDLHQRLKLISTDDPSLIDEVWEYIDSAKPVSIKLL
ncbi:MAG: STAS-like domain-containing protein [Sulfuricella sp.]|nr:STAS-like domain-containing protein [Sulfuricella sp.]